MGALGIAAIVSVLIVVWTIQIALGPGLLPMIRRDAAERLGPAELQRRDRQAALLMGGMVVIAGAVVGLGVAVGYLAHSAVAGWIFSIVGLVVTWGIGAGLVFWRQIRQEIGGTGTTSQDPG